MLQRVLANSFRPRRYAHLLGQPLPTRSPFGRGRLQTALWRELHRIQRRAWQEPEYLDEHTQDFSGIVSALHGRPPPRWYREQTERRRRLLDARWGIPLRERLPQRSGDIESVLAALSHRPPPEG